MVYIPLTKTLCFHIFIHHEMVFCPQTFQLEELRLSVMNGKLNEEGTKVQSSLLVSVF